MIDKVCRVVRLRVFGRQALQQMQICKRYLIVLGCCEEVAPIANRWGRSLVLGCYVLNRSVELLAVEHLPSSPVSGLRQRLAVRVYIIGQGIKGQQVFEKRYGSFFIRNLAGLALRSGRCFRRLCCTPRQSEPPIFRVSLGIRTG